MHHAFSRMTVILKEHMTVQQSTIVILSMKMVWFHLAMFTVFDFESYNADVFCVNDVMSLPVFGQDDRKIVFSSTRSTLAKIQRMMALVEIVEDPANDRVGRHCRSFSTMKVESRSTTKIGILTFCLSSLVKFVVPHRLAYSHCVLAHWSSLKSIQLIVCANM